jgi:pimeloyl-ACP methyl ester carboxylesterase
MHTYCDIFYNERLMKKIYFIFLLFAFCFSSAKSMSQDGFIPGKPSLAFWTVGNQDEIIIVLHGGPGAAHNYLRPEWDHLSSAAKVIYYDQRGCGKSDRSDCYGWKEHVSDLKRVITHFSKNKKVILAGSSWGYTLALLYAATNPSDVKGIILSGTTAWLGKGETLKDCTSYLPNVNKEFSKVDTTGTLSLAFSSPDVGRMNKFRESPRYIEVNNISFNATIRSLAEAPTLQELEKIIVPVLIFEGAAICGQYSRPDASRILEKALIETEVFTIMEACHDPWYTHSEIFFEKCLFFIKKIYNK